MDASRPAPRVDRFTPVRRRAARAGCLAIVAFPVLGAPAWAQRDTFDAVNVTLLGRFGGRDAYSDVWGYRAPDGTELAILGSTNGIHFVNVTNPASPAEVLFQDANPSSWRDFATHDHYAYAVSEGGHGLMIFDLSNPRLPILVGSFTETFDTAHTLGIHDGFAYCSGARLMGLDVGMRILDLANPMQPVDVGTYGDAYFHDVYVRNNIAYGAALGGGIMILDVNDKRNPRRRSVTGYPGAFTHNTWLTDDSRYLLSTDETSAGHIRIWDLANVATPMQVAEWSATQAGIVHNVYIKGNRAYAAYYTEGLQVLDITDPTSPLLVGFFDTFPGTSGGFRGCWGAYPFLPSGHILVSDITNGLFIVRVEDGQAQTGFELHAPPPVSALPGGPPLYFFFELQNTLLNPRTYSISVDCPLGWAISYNTTVQLAAQATELVLVTVQVPAGLTAQTTVHLRMCARDTRSGFSKCASTEGSTPVALQAFDAAWIHDQGVSVAWEVTADAGDPGRIGVLRAPQSDPGHWSERAWFGLASGTYVDADVPAGSAWVYALALDAGDGPQILAQRTVTAGTPSRSRLVGNWPNPFNPSTRIRFDLDRPGDVALRIFDARGRVLQEMSRPGLPAGSHTVTWTGRDDHGNQLPSGVYFYEVQSGRWRARDRMILAR